MTGRAEDGIPGLHVTGATYATQLLAAQTLPTAPGQRSSEQRRIAGATGRVEKSGRRICERN